MGADRLLAMTDGVVAIIITIMALELKIPGGASLAALGREWPVFVAYALSFTYVAIYWNNHHHYFQLVRRVNGAVLWANFHLLFWLSLVPFATAWLGEHRFAPGPTAVYGIALFMPALAWRVMEVAVLRAQDTDSQLTDLIGRGTKGWLSAAIYAVGIGLSFTLSWASLLCYLAVALMWLVPDRRIEKMLSGEENQMSA
jgi:uncharacterized membrane protein